MIAMVKTKKTAYELYLSEEKYYQDYNIHISSKNTIMEYTTKIGFLTGTYVKIAAPKHYIKDIRQKLNVKDKIIDVKKEYTYDKGKRSKVLVVYATEESADQIDKQLGNIKSKRYRYVSYKRTSSDSRLASMHYNDMINRKARYETLVNASLNERIMIESRCQVTLESYIMSLKDGENNLFIAAEQGVGKYENNVTVILNPRTSKKAKQWLVNEYHKLNFKESRERQTSVNEKQYEDNSKYNEELIEFLKPTLESKEAAKNKTYGKSMKSYAQALGIKQYSTPPTNPEKVTKNADKKNKNRKNMDVETKNIVIAL